MLISFVCLFCLSLNFSTFSFIAQFFVFYWETIMLGLLWEEVEQLGG